MDRINKFLKRMDEENKVGWNEEGFSKLSKEEKIVVSTMNLIYQTYNGGVTQYFYNGYGFADEFLKNEAFDILDCPELIEWLEKAEKLNEEYQKLGMLESAYGLEGKLDKLDKEFYKGLGDKLEENLKSYLEEVE
jgi:hypothetical protein